MSRPVALSLALTFWFAGAPAVLANCTVSTTGMDFGTYNPFELSDNDSTGSFTINCDSKTRTTVSLSTGASGTYTNRVLENGSYILNYNLYINNNRTRIWGDGSEGSRTKRYNRKNVTKAIRGRIFAGQTTAHVGLYSDTVTLTVEY